MLIDSLKQQEKDLLNFNDALSSIGGNMYSDDFCCKLLAVLHVFGTELGESVVINRGLTVALAVAQKRLNIEGGEIPNIDLMKKLKFYVRTFELAYKRKKITKVAKEIFDRYNIPIKRITFR